MNVGLMGLAPIHAAGDHENGSRENTLSHIISSYTPTLRALQYVRQKTCSLSSKSKILIVAMPETSGHATIYVGPEVEAINTVFGDLVAKSEYSHKSKVLEKLPECAFAHFACNGKCDAKNPSEGGLQLMGGDSGLFRISELDKVNVPLAEIAYLSASSTAEIAANDLVDEAIHLANGFQLIGFGNVIGTMCLES